MDEAIKRLKEEGDKERREIGEPDRGKGDDGSCNSIQNYLLKQTKVYRNEIR